MYKILFLFFCLLSTPCLGQITESNSRPLYYAQVQTLDNSSFKGAVYGFNDSTISLYNLSEAKKKQIPADEDLVIIPVQSIETIKFRRVGVLGVGLVLGGVIGGIAGAVIGNASYEPCQSAYGCFEIFDEQASTTMGGVAGLVVGSGLGLAMASTRQKFKINGSRENFIAKKEDLVPFVYIPPTTPQPVK